MKKLNASGFEGENVFLAGHSLGGTATQGFSYWHSDKMKGSIFWGHSIPSLYRKPLDSGKTQIDYAIPTLTILGDKDGFHRLTLSA